jgi:hypothetical protein
MTGLRLFDPPGSALDSQRRSLLYIAGFCLIAFAIESVYLFSPSVNPGRDWYLWLPALLCGLMALAIRLHAPVDAARAPRPRVRPESPPQAPEAATSLDDLGSWRSQRARTFSAHDLRYLPPLPDAPAASTSRKTRKRKQTKSVDPWEKVLEDLDRRDARRF